jgi:tetratricopeptide (TPR) repeat protein
LEYIAITILAITITIFIVYKLANNIFGLGLKLKPLLLCAICALLLSIVIPRIVVGFAGLAGTLGFLAVFAVLFAYFVAYYDEAQDSQMLHSAVSVPEQNNVEKNIPVDLPPQIIHDVSEDESHDFTAIVSEAVSPMTFIPSNNELEDASQITQVPPSEEEPLPETLDDLLDLAFTYKEDLNFSQALKCFRKALSLYPESEAAPYLVVEIANIHRNKGAYDEAIQVLAEGRNLPGVLPNSTLAQEFTETIAYLRITRNTLLHRRLGFIPFNKIPSDVCHDIDTEFREWRNLA